MRSVLNRSAVTALLLGSLLFLSKSAYGETFALLVGVSGYPSLPEQRRLRGPANDVALLRSALIRSGLQPKNIAVLADGVVDSQALPTHGNILEKMRVVGTTAKTGDWVVMYFSGHGSQQPQPPKSKLPNGTYIEPDGLDEIFLPYDVARWNGQTLSVEGALIDDEVGAEFASMSKRGVRVWAIFDTCHAGDMAKGVTRRDDGPVTRYVSPISLGIPSDLMQAAKTIAAAGQVRPKGSSTAGARPVSQLKHADQGLVTFYASHSDEPATEEFLPAPTEGTKDAAPDRPKRYFGLFTYLLAQALPSWKGDFRELADGIAQRYKTRPYPTPMFEGNLNLTPSFRHVSAPSGLTGNENLSLKR